MERPGNFWTLQLGANGIVAIPHILWYTFCWHASDTMDYNMYEFYIYTSKYQLKDYDLYSCTKRKNKQALHAVALDLHRPGQNLGLRQGSGNFYLTCVLIQLKATHAAPDPCSWGEWRLPKISTWDLPLSSPLFQITALRSKHKVSHTEA